MIKKLVGTKEFYRKLLVLMLPIMVQNGISNFVNMLDNIMIGTVGTAQMTGVAITNQLIFIFNLCIFGAVSGAGIFGAQFFGNEDYEGVRHTFRFKVIFGGGLCIFAIGFFLLFGEFFLKMYMQGEQGITDAAATLGYAKDYLAIMLIGLLPFALVQCYSSTLREGGKPNLPMYAGVIAVIVNLVFNYILIFGKFGAPKLGVNGAAIATVISRFVELLIVVLCSHKNTDEFPFMKGIYKSLYLPKKLAVKLFIKGLPLMLNETLWALGIAVVNQCYSMRGLDAVAAVNISQTFWNVFSIAYMAVGAAIGIILGQMLGANKLKEAKEESYKMIAFSFAISVCVAAIYAVCAEYIPAVYNTEPEIRHLATRLMQLTAISMPFDALAHASYFTMRSGGKMMTTFIFDCGFTWCGNVAIAFILTRFTSISFLALFAIMQGVAIIKAFVGLGFVKNGFWVKNIIEEKTED